MARVTDADIIELIDIDSTENLDPFINAANELVTELCSDSGYTAIRLAMIEAWLAAHFFMLRDQTVSPASERAGEVGITYQYKIGLMLQQTKQGQTAMLLDTDGNLAALSKQLEEGQKMTSYLFWPGEDYDAEDDEDS